MPPEYNSLYLPADNRRIDYYGDDEEGWTVVYDGPMWPVETDE